MFREGVNVYAAVIKPSLADLLLFHKVMRVKVFAEKYNYVMHVFFSSRTARNVCQENI